MRDPRKIYLIERKTDYIVLDMHTFEMRTISKHDFNKKNMMQLVSTGFKSGQPYQFRLSPVNKTTSLMRPTIVTGFDCNYLCEYCYQKSRRISQYGRMLPEDVALIHRFYEEYCQRYSCVLQYGDIGIIGGEPLLPDNAETLIAIGEMWKDNKLIITTNGTYIVDYVSFFSKYRTKVRVSLDGTKAMHYSQRKTSCDDAYDKAICGIKLLLSMGIEVQILSVFPKESISCYPAYFDMLEEIGWLQNRLLSIAFIPEIGCGCDDIQLENIMNAIKAYCALADIDKRTLKVDARKIFPGKINLNESISLAKDGKFEPYRCSALYDSNFAFLPDGTVQACLAIEGDDQHCIGRFKPEIVINDEFIIALKNRRIELLEQCSDCIMRALCRGGCLATAYKYTQNISKPYCSFWKQPDFLHYY